MSSSTHSRKKVVYYYDRDIGNYYYGMGHPMKPHRIRMTHNLILNYGLHRILEIYRPHKSTAEEMAKFHSDDYIRFLRSIRPDNMAEYNKQMQRFNVGEDCPVFDGLYEFCQLSAGGSVAGAVKLNKEAADIAVNWAGGLHHAKKSEASGFCYVNDIVLAIVELLKYHQRVLYIDIDVHHGDGVEEAFYTTDRVMTVSFHKYGEFFPGTGDLRDIGAGKGKYYAVNFPLRDGIDDESYESIFMPVIAKVMETYQPAAIVLQCGADSLAGDRLGSFNLTLKGHAKCVEFVKKYNLPLLLLGGGGYTIRNVARCWTYETAVAVGTDIANELPYNDYFEYFEPDFKFKLHISPSKMANQNTPEYLHKVKTRLFENLRMLPCAPGVELREIPEDAINIDDGEEEDEESPDVRISMRASDKRIANDNEFSDSEDEGEGQKDRKLYKANKGKRARRDDSGSSSNNATGDKKETQNGIAKEKKTTVETGSKNLTKSGSAAPAKENATDKPKSPAEETETTPMEVDDDEEENTKDSSGIMEGDDKIDESISKILESVQGLVLERSTLTTEEVEQQRQIQFETDERDSVIWTNVFQWLDTKSLNRALVVSKTWNHIGNNPLLWKSTNLDSTKLTDKIISRVVRYQPTSLSLNKAIFTGNELCRLLSKLPDLEHLSVKESECSNLAVLRSCWCPTLTRLDMANVEGLTDDFVQSLFLRSVLFRARHGDEIDFGCRLKNSQYLGLAGTNITNSTVEMLTERTRSIRELDLSGCGRISNKGIGFLANSPFVEKLTHLNISGCKKLTGACESHLLKLSNLVVLDIRNTSISLKDAVVQRLKKGIPEVIV